MLVAQSFLTLCDPMDYNPWGSSVLGILLARILEWVANSFSRGSSEPRDQTQVSCIASRFFPSKPPGKPKIYCRVQKSSFWTFAQTPKVWLFLLFYSKIEFTVHVTNPSVSYMYPLQTLIFHLNFMTKYLTYTCRISQRLHILNKSTFSLRDDILSHSNFLKLHPFLPLIVMY